MSECILCYGCEHGKWVSWGDDYSDIGCEKDIDEGDDSTCSEYLPESSQTRFMYELALLTSLRKTKATSKKRV